MNILDTILNGEAFVEQDDLTMAYLIVSNMIKRGANHPISIRWMIDNYTDHPVKNSPNIVLNMDCILRSKKSIFREDTSIISYLNANVNPDSIPWSNCGATAYDGITPALYGFGLDAFLSKLKDNLLSSERCTLRAGECMMYVKNTRTQNYLNYGRVSSILVYNSDVVENDTRISLHPKFIQHCHESA